MKDNLTALQRLGIVLGTSSKQHATVLRSDLRWAVDELTGRNQDNPLPTAPAEPPRTAGEPTKEKEL